MKFQSSNKILFLIMTAYVISPPVARADVITQSFALSFGGGYVAAGGQYSNLIQSVYGSPTGWLGWGYDASYISFSGDPTVLETVRLSVTYNITDANETTDTFGSRVSLFTGWNTVDYQFSSTIVFSTDGAAYTREWLFTGAAANAWANPAYGPNGHFYLEVFSASSGFTSVGDATLTFNTIPAPGAMALLGLAGLFSRRRRV